jgi:WD40 repeat protein/Tfp pilus assembly protein PilF
MLEQHAQDRIVGKYRMLRVLGRGGVGVTYEGEPLGGGGHVAIKELRLSQVDDWKLIELFDREARVLSQVTHPAVPAYVDHFSIDDASGPAFYLVQELAPGQSLASLVAGGWRADEAAAKRIAEALLDVLDYLHARRPPVYHRDIKPLNVLREDGGKVWLVDFGAVRDVYRSTAVGGSTVAGTFGYMAPEQLRGVARPESDLHGLGATLLYVLSGRAPSEMPQRKLKTDFRPHVHVSAGFADWLEKMMEPAPEDRFPSAQQALVALRGGSAPATPVVRPHRKRTLALAGALGIALTALGAVGTYELRARAVKAFNAMPRLPERPAPWSFPAVQFVRTIPAAFSAIMSVAFTPDGERLITGAWDETAKIWDARTGEAVRALPGHTMPVSAVRVTSDGRQGITAGDHTLKIWALPEGKLLRTIDVGARQVFSADVSPDGNILVSGDNNGLAKLWTLDGRPLRTLEHGGGRVLTVTFSPDGTRVASSGADRTIKVWDVAEGKLQCVLAGHAGEVSSIRIAPDGQVLASASDVRSVRLWHIQSCRQLKALSLHSDEAWSLAFSPDGGTLVTGGKDDVMGVWSVPSLGLRQRVDLGHDARGTLAIAFAPNGVTFATAHGVGKVWLWRLARQRGHQLPEPALVETAAPANATQEQQTYLEAMDLIESYGPDPRPLDEADSRLQSLLDANPRSALALAGLGRSAFKRSHLYGDKYNEQQLDKASDFANRAAAADPSFADGFIVRGWTLIGKKDVGGARTALNVALKLAPTFPRTLLLAAEVSTREGDLEGAERQLREALTHPINHRLAAGAFASLADIYERMGDVDTADKAHQRNVALVPELAWAKGNYANFLVNKGDWDAAIVMAQKALGQMQYGAAKRTLANAYCGQGASMLWDNGNPDGGARAFRSALEADPTNSCGFYGLGAYEQYTSFVQRDASHLSKARTWYARAVALDPSSESARHALGAVN